jgi:hypothetical protein
MSKKKKKMNFIKKKKKKFLKIPFLKLKKIFIFKTK